MKKQLLLLITFISTYASYAQCSLTERLSATSSKISVARTDEIIIYIIEFLDQQSLMSLAQVNRKYNGIVAETLGKLLLKKHNGNLLTALFDAVESNNALAINYLLQQGVDVNVIVAYGRTPVMCAARYGHNNAMAQLIQANANVDATDSSGWTALIWAAREGRYNVIPQLVQAKANVNAAGMRGETALILAANNDTHNNSDNYNKVVVQLIQANANVNTTNKAGETALMAAVRDGGHTQIVQTLLDGKAHIHLTDNKGKTALDIALKSYANDNVVRILQDSAPKNNCSIE